MSKFCHLTNQLKEEDLRAGPQVRSVRLRGLSLCRYTL